MMFGKSSYNYNNYVPTSYTSLSAPGVSLSTASSPCTSSSSSLSTFVSLQDFNELNQNNNLLNSVYNQIHHQQQQNQQQPINIDTNLSKTTPTYDTVCNNSSIGNLFMNRSPATYSFGFNNPFTASYISAAVAAVTQHGNNFNLQSNCIGSNTSTPFQTNVSTNEKLSPSLQPINSSVGYLQQGSCGKPMSGESKMSSLTPTSSSTSCLSSASSPNCLSESVESNLNHSNESMRLGNTITVNTMNNSAPTPTPPNPVVNANFWDQSQSNSKSENVWPMEKKRSGITFSNIFSSG